MLTAIELKTVSSEFLVIKTVSKADLWIRRDHILGSRLSHQHWILLKLDPHLRLHSDNIYLYLFYKSFIYTYIYFLIIESKLPKESTTNPCLQYWFSKGSYDHSPVPWTSDPTYLHQQKPGVRCCRLKSPSMTTEVVTKVEEQGLIHRIKPKTLQWMPSNAVLLKEMV